MEDEQTNQEIPEGYAVQAFQDDQQDFGDHVRDNQEEQQFGFSPDVKERESIFSWFTRVLGLKDSSKVANLDKRELGFLDLSVRNCEALAGMGTLLGNKSFHDYFMSRAEITLATSMSKKGWLPELIVSQKKFSQRTVQPITESSQKKAGFLGFGKKPQQPQ